VHVYIYICTIIAVSYLRASVIAVSGLCQMSLNYKGFITTANIEWRK